MYVPSAHPLLNLNWGTQSLRKMPIYLLLFTKEDEARN